MKHFLVVFALGLLITSCKKAYTPRTIDTITIQEHKIDSTSIRAITAIHKDTIYFAGSNGNVGFTNDGGKNWIIQTIRYQDSITPEFRSIATNGKNIFILSIGNPALLYKISNSTIDLVYTEQHPKVFYDSMQFFSDGKHGIAVGDPTEDCPSIIMTTNGGNSWTKISCDKLPKFENNEAFFAASNTNIKTINNTVWIVSGGKKARVLKSEDKGKTWQIFNTPIVQGNGSQGIYSVDFIDEKQGIIIGGDYSKPMNNYANKAITIDGGETWNLIANNKNPSYKSCIQYVPNTNGQEVFAIGKTGISFSNNNGKSWKKVSSESYYSIQFINKNTAWLSGNQIIGKIIVE